MAQDALEVIKADHDGFRDMLNQYEEVDPEDHPAKRQLVDDLIVHVVAHSYMEEKAFYPFVQRELPDLDRMIREEIEEHHAIELLMAELNRMAAEHAQFDAKVEVFAENLLHHLHEEEDELFPLLRERLPAEQLVALSDELRTARTQAPTEPDPDRVGG